jgi:hypothetical protein
MGNVKGSMLLEFVKAVRADKSGVYDSYLTEKDKEIISLKILNNTWYPYETYENCFKAVFNVVAKGDLKTIYEWGRIYGEKIITSIYKPVITEGNPRKALEMLELITKLHTIKDFAQDFEPYFHLSRGWIERCLELSGAKNVKSEFISKSWEGTPETTIKFSLSI